MLRRLWQAVDRGGHGARETEVLRMHRCCACVCMSQANSGLDKFPIVPMRMLGPLHGCRLLLGPHRR